MLTTLVKDGYGHQVTSARHPRDLRASDADRERVAALLAEAVADGRLTVEEHAERVQRAYTARTLGDLAGLTQDLAGPSAQPLRLDQSRSIAALFSTQRREGRWIVPDKLTVTAVGGQVVLDLRDAVLQGHHTVIQASLVVGGQLNVLVPEGVRVEVTRSRSGPGAAPRSYPAGWRGGGGPGPASPLIEIRAFTLGGRIRVHTPRRGRRWPFPRR
jgi:uncharacterized protein DUF1707